MLISAIGAASIAEITSDITARRSTHAASSGPRMAVDRLIAWAIEAVVPPQSGIGKAIASMQNLVAGQRRDLHNPQVPLDNNPCMRALCAVITGRQRSRRGPASLFRHLVGQLGPQQCFVAKQAGYALSETPTGGKSMLKFLKCSMALIALVSGASALICVDASQAQVASPLIFAKVSSDDVPSHVATRYGKLLQALSREIGRPVVFQTKGTYEQMAKSMGRGAFDIVSAGPALYLEHEARYEPVARPARKGRAEYAGLILVRSESPVKNLIGLRGLRLGLVSKRSTSGYLLPRLMLEEAGLSLDRDFRARVRFYGGNHTEVARALNRGEIDAGAVFDDARRDAFGQDQAALAKTRILARTPEIPTDPVIVSKRLDAGLKGRIAAFFMGCARRVDAKALMDPIDEQVTSWVKASPQDYEIVRRYRADFLRSEQRGR